MNRAFWIFVVSGLVAATVAVVVRRQDDSADATRALQRVIEREARAANDPWTLAHVLLALGPEFVLANGDSVIVTLVRDHLKDAPEGPRFELGETSGTLGEVHPHLVLKTLMELELEAELCRELIRAALARLRKPRRFEEWNDLAWLLEALARHPDTVNATPLSDSSSTETLGSVAESFLTELEGADEPVESALATGGASGFERPSGNREPAESGIYAYTCGGQHAIQAVFVAFEAGLLPASERARVEARLKTFMARLFAEAGFRERERARALDSGLAPQKVAAQHALSLLKLYGHGLETLARARDAGLGDAAEIRRAATRVRWALGDTLRSLARRMDLGKILARLRGEDIGTWRLWFGDACHALRGVARWRGS